MKSSSWKISYESIKLQFEKLALVKPKMKAFIWKVQLSKFKINSFILTLGKFKLIFEILICENSWIKINFFESRSSSTTNKLWKFKMKAFVRTNNKNFRLKILIFLNWENFRWKYHFNSLSWEILVKIGKTEI